MLNITREKSVDLLADAPQWDALSAGNPLRQSIWLRTWWESFATSLGDESELYLVTARQQDGKLVAALPLFRQRLQHRMVLQAIGQGDACTDYVTLLVDPRQDAQNVGFEIGRWLAAAAKSPNDYWDVLDVDGIVEGDVAIKGVAAALQEERATVQALSRMNVWFKPTNGDSWEDYLTGLSKTNRKKTRRRSWRAEDDPTLSWRTITSGDDVLQAVEQLIDLHQSRWQAAGESGSFASVEMRLFIKSLAERLHANNQLRIPVLTKDEQVIASEFQILGADKVLYCYSSAMDTQHPDIEPGHVISSSTVRFAYEQGLAGVNMMRGDEPYKERLKGQPQQLIHLYAVAPSIAPRLKQAAWAAAFGAKQWFRGQLGREPVTSIDL